MPHTRHSLFFHPHDQIRSPLRLLLLLLLPLLIPSLYPLTCTSTGHLGKQTADHSITERSGSGCCLCRSYWCSTRSEKLDPRVSSLLPPNSSTPSARLRHRARIRCSCRERVHPSKKRSDSKIFSRIRSDPRSTEAHEYVNAANLITISCCCDYSPASSFSHPRHPELRCISPSPATAASRLVLQSNYAHVQLGRGSSCARYPRKNCPYL